MTPLTRDALPSDTVALARFLLGKLIVRRAAEGIIAGRVVETEAYPPGDRAMHAYRRMTERNRSLFLPHGHAYVYLCYGISQMLNVSSEPEGVGAGVLFRALEPIEGIALMMQRRRTTKLLDLARGPGRLAQALGIDRSLDGIDLCDGGPLHLADDGTVVSEIGESTRIGITKDADRVLRYFIPGSRYVSGPAGLNRFPNPASRRTGTIVTSPLPRLATHSGKFHCDDAFAYATLRFALGLREPGIDHSLIRTRDRAEIDAADIVWDVGTRYDPAARRFDHHQRGAPVRPDSDLPFSSAGLVWQAYGVTAVRTMLLPDAAGLAEPIAAAIDRAVIRRIDAIDNGVAHPEDSLGLSSVVDDCNLPWDSPEAGDAAAETRAFVAAADLMAGFLRNRVEQVRGKLAADAVVVAAHRASHDPRILELDRRMPWQSAAFRHELPVLYAVYPVPAGNWMVDAMPAEKGSFSQRLPLPAAWGGLEADALAAISGIEDAVFVHTARFVGAARSRNGALRMAAAAIAMGEHPVPGSRRGRMIDPAVRDRAHGALLGLAVGDALGTTLEFTARDRMPHHTEMIGRGPFSLAPGVWTDDTSMALALADSLIHCQGFDAADLMNRFVDWWQFGQYSATGACFDIGVTTREALERYEATKEPFAGHIEEHSAGNGSLMRLAPVALFALDDDAQCRRIAAEQSRTTHGAPQAVESCIYFADLLRRTILGANRESVLAPVEWVGHRMVRAIAAGGWIGKERAEIHSTGYVIHTLEAALWAVDQTADFEDALILAVNLADDADTVGAVTGQLAGALYGAAAIPPRWLAPLAWHGRIVQMADALLTRAPLPQRPRSG